MTQFVYEGVTYNSKKELKQDTGLNSTKIKGMLKCGKITFKNNNTNIEGNSYEKHNQTTSL